MWFVVLVWPWMLKLIKLFIDSWKKWYSCIFCQMICLLFVSKVATIYYNTFPKEKKYTLPSEWEKIVIYKERSVLALTIILNMLAKEGPKFLSNISFLLFFTIATLTTQLVFSKTVENNFELSSTLERLDSNEDHQLKKNHFGKYERYANDFL